MSERESGRRKRRKKHLFWAFLISLSWTRKLTERTRSLHSRLLQKQMLTPKKYWFFMLFLLAENWAEASTNDHLFNWDTYKKKTNISCVRLFCSCRNRSDVSRLPQTIENFKFYLLFFSFFLIELTYIYFYLCECPVTRGASSWIHV